MEGFVLESRYLKDNIENIQRLMAIPALKNFEARSLSNLLKLSKIRQYEDGEVIIQEGDSDAWLYFLLSGALRIERNGLEIGTLNKEGEIFGEMRIVDNLSRSATVKAIGKTVCLAVDTTNRKRLSRPEDDTAREQALDFVLLLYRIFAEYMSIRLRLTNEELVTAKKEVNRLVEQLNCPPKTDPDFNLM
jgi:CRP-like cAMP-binding protein